MLLHTLLLWLMSREGLPLSHVFLLWFSQDRISDTLSNKNINLSGKGRPPPLFLPSRPSEFSTRPSTE